MYKVAPVRSMPYLALLQLNTEAKNESRKFLGRNREAIYRTEFLRGVAQLDSDNPNGFFGRGAQEFYQQLVGNFGARNYGKVSELLESALEDFREYGSGQMRILGLTPREVDVLGELAYGHGNKTIAQHLDLAEITVKKHVQSIYRKLPDSYPHTRIGATRWYIQHISAV